MSPLPIIPKALFLCASVLLSYFILSMLLRSPLVSFFRDTPDARKMHHKPVPRLGGIAIITSFLIMLAVSFLLQKKDDFFPAIDTGFAVALLISSSIIWLFGFLDDSTFVTVRARHKIAAELLISFSVVYLFKIHSGPLSFDTLFTFPLWFSKIISVLWVLGIINAFNIIDGIDGLAGGISLIAVLTLALLANLGGQGSTVFLCLMLAGSIIGFLFHNMPPAKTFMGDTGSLFLGTMVAIFSLHVAEKVTSTRTIIIIPLIAGVPIVEVLVTMVRRYFKAKDKRRSLFQSIRGMAIPDNSHIHHRFMFRGFTHFETAVILFIIASTLSCGAIALYLVPRYLIIPVLAYLSVPIIIALDRLGFGGRFKKALGISNTRLNGYKKVALVGIIDEDGSLSRVLEQEKREDLIFVPITAEDASNLSTSFRAAVIRDNSTENGGDNLNRAEKLSYDICGPVYIVKSDESRKLFVNEVHRNGTLVTREGQKTIKELVKELSIVSSRSKIKHTSHHHKTQKNAQE